ncbi:MAG: proline--tRNA ligase [Candidatus Bathyarchaeota archaeon]|nr:proline--tRNA ligase [Candidatus Bathyarchaeota archaeon]
MSELGVTVRKSEDFSEWYTQVILKSELADYAPIKGCIVFREYSYAIWEKIQDFFNKKIKETGHKNAYFPLFIPESFLRREAEHFEGFNPEVAWITMGGNSELEERLAVRPTSETIMYTMYKKWIRGWRDLPLKLNQWCNIVRWETAATKPFLRTREFLWQEGHTAHATKEEADKEVMDILNIYKDLVESQLAIPVLIGIKTENEKFAGALYTTALEAVMPDGKVLQLGTSHNLGQNFSKVFEIKFIGEDEEEHYVWQTSWGVSTRLIGAMVMVHGDDRGLVLPPREALYQVVIVPIPYKHVERDVIPEKARKVLGKLQKRGISAILDDREEYTPGWKFNHWELKGVPIRIEIGPKDVEKEQVIAARRDTLEKVAVKDEELAGTIEEMLEEIQDNLFNRAKKFLNDNITTVKTYDEFKEVLEKKGGFIKACWCSESACEEKIKEETGATIRLIPFEKEKVFSNCIFCGKKADQVVFFARAY